MVSQALGKEVGGSNRVRDLCSSCRHRHPKIRVGAQEFCRFEQKLVHPHLACRDYSPEEEPCQDRQ